MIKHDDFEYMPHQLDGIRWMARNGSCILADDMGLGKTLEALTVAAIDYQNGHAKRFLVIAPGTLKANWEVDIEKFTRFTSMILAGTPKQREKQLAKFAESDTQFLITNYEQIEKHVDELNAIGFDNLMIDEAHNLRNRTAKRTKAVKKLMFSHRVIPMTGSPLLNNVEELWTLLNMVRPADFPKYWPYRNRYVVFGGFEGRQVVGVKNEAELHTLLSNVMLRREKADVIDLPEKLYTQVWVDLLPVQRKLYDEALRDEQITIPGDPNPMQIENVLTRFLHLKKIIGSAATIDGYEDESAKLDAFVERTKQTIEAGHPVVVFTQFRLILALAAKRLRDAGIPVHEMHGDVLQGDRVPLVEQWSQEAKAGKPGVMLSMFQVGGVGLNMTASSYIFLIDRLYVPKLNEQAVDRCHRIGVDKTRPVEIVEFLARKTLDARITAILTRKSAVFETVVNGTEWKREFVRAVLAGE